ncbi:MAG TPA: Do family serine endopeptidase [Bryobacteraceae bacterium]|nr:Do family serine endopeptidase [Bryobacteraceae bacterium]
MRFFDKARNQKFLTSTIIVFTLALGVLIGTVVQTGVKAAKDNGVAAPDATPLTIPPREQLQSTFAEIAKKLEPSVVNISVEFGGQPSSSPQASNRGGNNRRRLNPNNGDNGDDNGQSPEDFFRRFFGSPGGGGVEINPFGGGGGEAMPSRALGSGVVVDKNGYILTNNHVVDKATKMTVKFTNDDTEYPAHVIGTDPETDLAVIKIDKRDLTPARIGNSDSMRVGDWAMAIGSPLGFQSTVTAGIISALSRDVPEPTDSPTARRTANSFQHFIQTDAAINPGNSGGPLVNVNGEVIGINTMIASESGGYQGIGFALPINTAVKVYDSIIRSGKMTRGSIGITFPQDSPNTTSLLDVYGGVKQGVVVQEVTKGGPAEKAGLKPMDVIVSIDGKKITKGQDLIDQVADSTIGSTLKFGIIRDRKPMTVDITIADRAKTFADNPEVASNAPGGNGGPTEGAQKFGISIGTLSASDKRDAGYNGNGSVYIESVDPDSFADNIGLSKGDIILEINRQAVNSVADVTRIQSTLKAGDSVAFHISRQGGSGNGFGNNSGGNWQPMYLAGKLPASGGNQQ